MTFYLSNYLNFNFKLQLLRDVNVFVPLVDSEKYDIFKEVFKFNILKYKTTILNNERMVIGGDEKDYVHDIELFIKLNKSQENEIKISYGESNVIIESEERDKTIEKIINIVYRINVNLKPDVLIDNNKTIYFNKEFNGYVEIYVKLTTLSYFFLYFLSLLFMIATIKLLKEVYQFIFRGRKYWK